MTTRFVFDACRGFTHCWAMSSEPCEGIAFETHPNLPTFYCDCSCHNLKLTFKEKIQKVLDSTGRTLVKSNETTKPLKGKANANLPL